MTSATPYGSHVYWRLTLSNPNNYNYECAGLTLYEDPSFWVPLSWAGATVTASDGTSTAPLTDGSSGTVWSSTAAGGGPISLTIELATAADVIGYGWDFNVPDNNRFPKTMLLEHSDDGVAWTTAWNIADTTTSNLFDGFQLIGLGGSFYGGKTSIFYSPDYAPSLSNCHRYWRLYFTATVPNLVLDGTLEFRPDIGAPTLTHFGTALSSGDYSSSYANYHAFWELSGYYWCQTNGDSNCYIGYEFPFPVPLNEIHMQARGDWGGPTEFAVEYSDDGVTWTNDSWTQTAIPTWAANEVRLFPNPNLTPTIIAQNDGLASYAIGSGETIAESDLLAAYAVTKGVAGAANCSQLSAYVIQRHARRGVYLSTVYPLNCWQPCTPFAIFDPQFERKS